VSDPYTTNLFYYPVFLDIYQGAVYLGLQLCDGQAAGLVAGPGTAEGASSLKRGGQVSRGYEAKRKAKRRQARATDEKPQRRGHLTQSRRLYALIPVATIAAIFAIVAIVGFGRDSGVSQKQVQEKVTALLADIPQNGNTLGSPRAPITLFIFADVECPTVRRFVTSYLPSIIATWVRSGRVKLDYHSLQTDTRDEHAFFRQEIAALAAGRQDKMWNYLLTFVHEQGQEFTNYATDEFLTDIASQVPALEREQWRRDREDPLLSKQVALGVQDGHKANLSSTPSFLIGFTRGDIDQSVDKASTRKELEAFLLDAVESLRERARLEASQDVPTLGSIGSRIRGD